MGSTCRPARLVGPLTADRNVGEERNVFCSSYDCCLEAAVHEGWDSWTCNECPVFALGPAVPRLEDFAQTRVACE